MGKVEHIIADELIEAAPDRNANRVRVYHKDNGEYVIHFRNMKITLLTTEEVIEWQQGFATALAEMRAKNYMKNDL